MTLMSFCGQFIAMATSINLVNTYNVTVIVHIYLLGKRDTLRMSSLLQNAPKECTVSLFFTQNDTH